MNIKDAWCVNMIIYNYTWYCMQLNMLWFQKAGRKEYIIMVRCNIKQYRIKIEHLI